MRPPAALAPRCPAPRSRVLRVFGLRLARGGLRAGAGEHARDRGEHLQQRAALRDALARFELADREARRRARRRRCAPASTTRATTTSPGASRRRPGAPSPRARSSAWRTLSTSDSKFTRDSAVWMGCWTVCDWSGRVIHGGVTSTPRPFLTPPSVASATCSAPSSADLAESASGTMPRQFADAQARELPARRLHARVLEVVHRQPSRADR